MKNEKVSLFVAAGFFLLTASVALAVEYISGNMSISNVEGRTIISSRPSVIYMAVHNKGDAADRILSAKSPLAKNIEFHSTIMKDAIMRMRRIDVVEVPAHSQVEFKPGGLHFMVFGLKKDLAAGSKVPVTLTFKNAGPIDIKVKFGSMKKMKMN